METYMTKGHVADALLLAAKLAQELEVLGTTVAARDILGDLFAAAQAQNELTRSTLRALHDRVPDAR